MLEPFFIVILVIGGIGTLLLLSRIKTTQKILNQSIKAIDKQTTKVLINTYIAQAKLKTLKDDQKDKLEDNFTTLILKIKLTLNLKIEIIYFLIKELKFGLQELYSDNSNITVFVNEKDLSLLIVLNDEEIIIGCNKFEQLVEIRKSIAQFCDK